MYSLAEDIAAWVLYERSAVDFLEVLICLFLSS